MKTISGVTVGLGFSSALRRSRKRERERGKDGERERERESVDKMERESMDKRDRVKGWRWRSYTQAKIV